MIEKVKGAMRLAAVDARALELGLEPDLSLADARARLPDLAVFEHDPEADRRWLEELANGCMRYTPLVALDPPDTVILDVTGCAHLHGEEAGLAADIERRLNRLGMENRLAYATAAPTAAWGLARYAVLPPINESAAILELPVAALRLGHEAELGLKRAGLETIGDLSSRPAATIVSRFGIEAATILRRILGCENEPLARWRPTPRIQVQRSFAEPIARTEYALTVLEELAGETGGLLEQQGHGGWQFEAAFFRSDGLVKSLCIETSLPTRDPSALMRLFTERVEGLADPLDPGFGFDLVRLSVSRSEPLAPAQFGLDGKETSEAEIAALVDRLSTRLGRTRLLRLREQDSHVPERAQRAMPVADARDKAQWSRPAPDEPPLRPLHLFDPPQPIEVIAEVPDGPPHRFHWCRAVHDVRRFEGPERIASEWWRRKDGKGLTRDYYRVEDADGRRFWLFRHGLYGEREAHPRWYLHGLFA